MKETLRLTLYTLLCAVTLSVSALWLWVCFYL